MKKKLVSLFIAASMVASLTACGGNDSSNSSAAPEETPKETSTEDSGKADAQPEEAEASGQENTSDEQITLRMAWWGSQTRHDLTVEVIEMYEKEHPNVNIEYEFFSFDDYFTKLKTLVASDQVWDIFQLDRKSVV